MTQWYCFMKTNLGTSKNRHAQDNNKNGTVLKIDSLETFLILKPALFT